MSHAKHEVRLLRVAEDDINDIVTYIAADKPDAALRLVDRIEQKLEQLAFSPYSGSAASESSLASLGYRYLIIDNYLIFYVIEGSTVLIHRMIHGARDYRRLL